MALDREAAERLLAFREALLDEAARVNLTSVHDPEKVREIHLLDSLAGVRALPDDARRIVDVGTGGGLPGIPLALARPEARVTLVEATRRKAEACGRIAARLGLAGRVAVVWARAEEVGQGGGRESFDVAVVRAVAALPVAMELALPLVAPGGRAVFWKGPAAEEGDELGRGERAAALLGGGRIWVDRYRLPATGARRMLVVAEKARSTPAGYPRRPGVPSKRPLA